MPGKSDLLAGLGFIQNNVFKNMDSVKHLIILTGRRTDVKSKELSNQLRNIQGITISVIAADPEFDAEFSNFVNDLVSDTNNLFNISGFDSLSTEMVDKLSQAIPCPTGKRFKDIFIIYLGISYLNVAPIIFI